MFVPTKANVKLANGNMAHSQGIGIILCHYPNCTSIYPVVPVYYFPGHPSSTISLGALKFYVGSQNITCEPLENSGPIISCSNICMTGFIFYPASDIEHYQLVILHDLVVNKTNNRECNI